MGHNAPHVVAYMLEQIQNAVLTDGEKFIPVEEAALSLRLSPRKLKELLTRHGLATYSFGSRPVGMRMILPDVSSQKWREVTINGKSSVFLPKP